MEELTKKTNQRLRYIERLSYKVHPDAVKRLVESCITNKIINAEMLFLTPEIDDLSKKNKSHQLMAKVLN